MIIGRKVIFREEVPSTNDDAKALALEGGEEGTVIVARRQTAGKGRMGRQWSSPEGGIYLSIILRPKMPATEMLRLTVLSGVPVAMAIEQASGLEARLKWPNDVIVSGKKVAGLLMESSSVGGSVQFLVLGIGINLNSRQEDLEGENPGSLAALSGRTFDNEAFLHQLLFQLDEFYVRYNAGEVPIDQYRAMSSTLGRHVVGSVGDQKISGQATSVDEQGALIVKGDDGLNYRLDSVYSLRYE
jgi:BirA family biotin operon repressor/biotin-[acetyl-CoA-carboxylase] ligase